MVITIIIFALLYIIDQLTKYLSQILLTSTNRPFIPYVMSFELTYNQGAAFSSLDGSGWLLIIISSVASIVLMYFCAKNNWKTEKFKSFVLTMILAGCVGNLYDRIIMNIPSLSGDDGRKGVVDMIRFDFLDTICKNVFRMQNGFAICNVADVYLVIGLILLAIYILFFADKRKDKHEIKN